MDTRFVLAQDKIPTAWYNALPDLPEPLQPPLHPGTKEPVGPDDLAPLFPMALIEQEMTGAPTIDIPGPVLDILRLWRPTPLVRATRLEKALGTPARIYYKDESVSPAGSHKPNTAVAQAYYNQQDGTKRLATETGAGQWGSALSFALLAVRSRVQGLHGPRVVRAEAVPARDDGDVGHVGGALAGRRPDASRFARRRDQRRGARRRTARDDTHYSLGSVLNHVLLHQTIIGIEAKEQLALAGETLPDIVIGSCGGGSNLGGIALPFMNDASVKLLAVEPSSCPTLTGGKFDYDFGDTAHDHALVADVHARSRLRAAVDPRGRPAVSRRFADHLVAREDRAVWTRSRTRRARPSKRRCSSRETEGKIPAPETGHAIRAVIDEALAAKEANEERVILFNYSGHGFLDLQAYDDFNHDRLIDA